MASISNRDKLKIGILIRDTKVLENWELRIIKGILEHPDLELALLIKDERKQITSYKSRLKNKFKKNILTRKVLSNILFIIQTRIERLLFKQQMTVEIEEIDDKISKIDTIYLNPERKGFVDLFSQADADKVKAYDLDLILRFEFNIIHGNILTAARCGIWSFHHADNAINRGGPVGFWEIVNNEPCCGVTLQQLTAELDGGLIIDKACFNRHWSFIKTNNDVLESSVILLFKNIDLLLREGKITVQKSLTYYNPLYRKPEMRFLLIYMVRFYRKCFSYLFNKVFPERRVKCWALFVGSGNFLETALFRIQPLPLPKGVFWADPFIYRRESQLYAFFENYSYHTRRGKISVGKITTDGKKFQITEIRDVLDLDYHLSYPQIVEDEGELYMIPETHENKRLEIYHCTHFPEQWELYATAFEGEDITDTTCFADENGDKWLLLNKGWTEYPELYIYQISDLKLNKITPHRANPVLIDCKRARNGGAVFKREDGYYRPSQVNTHGYYGRGLQISKITRLSLDEYEEEDVITVEPNFRKGLIGIHHLHQLDDCYIFDACYKKY